MRSGDMLAQLATLADDLVAEAAGTCHQLTAGLVRELVGDFVTPGGRFQPAGALFSAYHFANSIQGNSAAGGGLCALAGRLAIVHGIALDQPFPTAAIFRQARI